MKYNRKKGDAVLIKWVDPTTSAGWFELEDLEHLDIVGTVGYFVKEDENTLWCATTYHSGTKSFADQLIFPKGCILHVETILEYDSKNDPS